MIYLIVGIVIGFLLQLVIQVLAICYLIPKKWVVAIENQRIKSDKLTKEIERLKKL